MHQFEISYMILGLGTLLAVMRLRGWTGKQSIKWSLNLLAGGGCVLGLITPLPFGSYLLLIPLLVFLRDALDRVPEAKLTEKNPEPSAN